MEDVKRDKNLHKVDGHNMYKNKSIYLQSAVQIVVKVSLRM